MRSPAWAWPSGRPTPSCRRPPRHAGRCRASGRPSKRRRRSWCCLRAGCRWEGGMRGAGHEGRQRLCTTAGGGGITHAHTQADTLLRPPPRCGLPVRLPQAQSAELSRSTADLEGLRADLSQQRGLAALELAGARAQAAETQQQRASMDDVKKVGAGQGLPGPPPSPLTPPNLAPPILSFLSLSRCPLSSHTSSPTHLPYLHLPTQNILRVWTGSGF